MSEVRIQSFPVKNLQYVFTPPGLPLVAKGGEEHGTTSILIRGGAGTGKTTLAVALAHAMAREGGGLVLYLTTEFSPAEIAYKASLLELRKAAVAAWPGGTEAAPGAIVVQHLSVLPGADATVTSADRKKGAIDAVWELLHGPGQRPELPVRVVVIDAFTLPDAGGDGPGLRADLVNFVQALEGEGISTVIVEELARGASDWMSFVVDVAFGLALTEDAETGELRRKLTCTKSRYATSLPGPHDYGLENNVPCLWPDLLRILIAQSKLPRIAAPLLFLPSGHADRCVRLSAGIFISPGDSVNPGLNVLLRTPGVRSLIAQCGSQTLVDTWIMGDDEGPFSIGWLALQVAQKSNANLCVLRGLESLLSRRGWQVPLAHVLEALRGLGMLVCVQSPPAEVAPILPISDFVFGVGPKARSSESIRSRRHKAASRWLLSLGPIIDREQTGQGASHPEARLVSSLKKARKQILGGFLEPASSTLLSIRSDGVEPGRSWRYEAEVAMDLDRLGSSQGVARLGIVLAEPSLPFALSFVVGWSALLFGIDSAVARAAFDAAAHETCHDQWVVIWSAVCAIQAGNVAARKALLGKLGTPDEDLVLDPLLRSLAAAGKVRQADRIIAEYSARHGLSDWMTERLRADTRLDASAPETLHEAAAQLESLASDDRLPLVHRAEVCHNLGVAKERLDDRAGAIPWFQRALDLNPYLDAAREELRRLGERPPPAPQPPREA